MIKLKDLLEQAAKYKSNPIASTFDANRIVPNATWKRDLNPVINNIKAFQREGYRLNQIKVIIKSGASLANATNRYEDEKNPKEPIHNFGGDPQFKGWIKKSSKIQRTVIDKGNQFLAIERGKRLRDLIVPEIQKSFPKIPVKNIIVDSSLQTQSAEYTVKAEGEPVTGPKPGQYAVGGGYRDPRYGVGRFMVFITPKTGTDSGRQLPDFGRGPGVGVFVTKEMAQNLVKNGDRQFTNYLGDPIDYEIAKWTDNNKQGYIEFYNILINLVEEKFV